MVAKFDAAGSLLWTREPASKGGDNALAVAVGAAGDVVATGEWNIHHWYGMGEQQQDALLWRFSPSGEPLWCSAFGPDARGYGVAVDAGGNAAVVGSHTQIILGPGPQSDHWTVQGGFVARMLR